MEDQALVEGSVVFKDEEGPVGDGRQPRPGHGAGGPARPRPAACATHGQPGPGPTARPSSPHWPPTCGLPPARRARHTPWAGPRVRPAPPGPWDAAAALSAVRPAGTRRRPPALPGPAGRWGCTSCLTDRVRGRGGGRCPRSRHFRSPHPPVPWGACTARAGTEHVAVAGTH